MDRRSGNSAFGLDLQLQSSSRVDCPRRFGNILCPSKSRERGADFRAHFPMEPLHWLHPHCDRQSRSTEGVPLGYILAFYHWGMYGILLGTNSFVIPGPGKFLPSLVTLFYGSGIYEISSYTLISSATFNLHTLYEKSCESSEPSGERKWRIPKFSKIESVLIALAILILAVSNYYEAIHIFHT